MKIFLQLFIIVILPLGLYAQEDIKTTQEDQQTELTKQLFTINDELEDNLWITRYNNYLTYRKLEKELAKIKKDAKRYGRWKGEKYKELSYQLYNKIKIKENELELISEYKDSPIGKKIKPDEISKPPKVTNPFGIIEAMTYKQQMADSIERYQQINAELSIVAGLLQTKYELETKLSKLEINKNLKKELKKLKRELKDFIMVVDIVSTTHEVYSKKITQITQEVNSSIEQEIWRTIRLVVIIFILMLVALIIKLGLKKYIQDDDRLYTTNKLINFLLIIIVVFILLFSYIENVSYLVTILGFASAGIAIALKDWFMSIFGWMAIMTSGAISVGDRIKVMRNGIEVVGDVLDISLFKISVREDITLTSYMKNRRTGRVFFIPNNYIFTDLIANYTFDGLRTVWDGIDIYITFDSNHKRAVEIAKTIVSQHAKGYTELTKKRLQKLRKKYVLRSANPEPRIFSFIEPYGIVISSWYYTNAYATLGIRSTISMEILDAFQEADDIHIAYPTQTLRVTGTAQSQAEGLLPGSSANGLFDPPVST